MIFWSPSTAISTHDRASRLNAHMLRARLLAESRWRDYINEWLYFDMFLRERERESKKGINLRRFITQVSIAVIGRCAYWRQVYKYKVRVCSALYITYLRRFGKSIDCDDYVESSRAEVFNLFLVSVIRCDTRMGWSVTKYFYNFLNRLLIF